jgi:hypothetical protein
VEFAMNKPDLASEVHDLTLQVEFLKSELDLFRRTLVPAIDNLSATIMRSK